MPEEAEKKLPDYMEKALAEGRGVIIRGEFFSRREDVPEEWFRTDEPWRHEDTEKMEAHLAARETIFPSSAAKPSPKTVTSKLEITNG